MMTMVLRLSKTDYSSFVSHERQERNYETDYHVEIYIPLIMCTLYIVIDYMLFLVITVKTSGSYRRKQYYGQQKQT